MTIGESQRTQVCNPFIYPEPQHRGREPGSFSEANTWPTPLPMSNSSTVNRPTPIKTLSISTATRRQPDPSPRLVPGQGSSNPLGKILNKLTKTKLTKQNIPNFPKVLRWLGKQCDAGSMNVRMCHSFLFGAGNLILNGNSLNGGHQVHGGKRKI